jgi:AGCS family alanine or glycine:cation symporter
MYYLSQGLSEKEDGWILNKKAYSIIGRVLAALYAIFIIGGAFGGGNMFQANQSYELFGKLLGIPNYLYGIILAGLVAVVIIGGIKRIGQTTEKIVPIMVVLYVGASLFIIATNITKLPDVLISIFTSAFSSNALYGGFVENALVNMEINTSGSLVIFVAIINNDAPT